MTFLSPSSKTLVREPSVFGVPVQLGVGGALALSSLAMRFAGLGVVVPFGLLSLVVIVFPFAFLMVRAIQAFDRSRLPIWWGRAFATLVGVATLCMYWPDRHWFLCATVIACGLITFRHVTRPRDGTTRTMVSAVLMVGAIYVVIWNCNYLALIASGSRLHDASLQALDQAVYSATFGRPIAYDSFFPLTHNSWVIAVLERAYLALFMEIALVLLLLARRPWALRQFVVRLAFCYGCGLVIFVLWPAAGPYLVYPGSVSATFSGETTRTIMQASLREFSEIRFGGQAVTGFGYFVGLPSLHVAMAVLCQFTIQQHSGPAGWLVAPINVLMIASTVVLGYHYLADVPAGMLLALGAIILLRPGQRAGRDNLSWRARHD